MKRGPNKGVSEHRLDVLTGRRFGRLLVLSRTENSTDGKPMWMCKCDCGKEKPVRAQLLRNGTTTSCGCLNRELTSKRSTTHGKTRTREWQTRHAIKERCLTQSCSSYAHYGGRGIRVCDKWLNSFESFLADMGERPGPGYSIDRIEPDGDYEPGNCRWATVVEQNRNKRTNVRYTINGKTQLAADWARESGLSHGATRYRVSKGIDLSLPLRSRGGTQCHKG